MKIKVHMHSRPAMCRTFYDGSVTVEADTFDEARERAIDKVAPVHGHRDWIIEKMETAQ